MLIGRPSPASRSPLLRSRSTGPQPLLLVTNWSADTAVVPAGGGATSCTEPLTDRLCGPPMPAKFAVAAMASCPGDWSAVGRSRQVTRHSWPGRTSAVHAPPLPSTAQPFGLPSLYRVVSTVTGLFTSARFGRPRPSVVSGASTPCRSTDTR